MITPSRDSTGETSRCLAAPVDIVTRALRCGGGCLLAGLFFTTGNGSEPKAQPDQTHAESLDLSEVTVLPDFVVTAKAPQLTGKWLSLSLRHTRFLSEMGEKEAREAIADFVVFQRYFASYLPEFDGADQTKTTVVVCKSEANFSALVGKPNRGAGSCASAGENLIVLDRSQLGVDRAELWTRQRWMSLMYERMSPAPPLWLQYAIRWNFMLIRIEGDKLTVGKAPFSRDPFFMAAGIAPVPFDVLFAMTRHDPKFEEYTTGNLKFDAEMQAAAFMHYCRFRAPPEIRTAYKRFESAVFREPATNALFNRIFGMDILTMQHRVRGYARVGTFTYETARYRFHADPNDRLEVRDAGPEEVIEFTRGWRKAMSSRRPTKGP